jgi:hypothetical protein
MAASRLNDGQKIEVVARFRAGETSQALAAAYSCSTATIIRAVRAVLPPEEYESLKQPPGRRPQAMGEPAALPLFSPPLPSPPSTDSPAAPQPEADRGVLAIDDADDFGDDDEDDDLLDDDGEGSSLAALFSQAVAGREGGELEVRPLADATLPANAYLLVDKTVELQTRPLSDFPELGPLAMDEQQRQALVVFLNPRQAKRQCGRSQRVIKIPDTRVLERTSRFLVAQGISRVLIEGSLYSLPGS